MEGPGTVVVWKSVLLNASETFIRNQVDSVREWRAVLVGAERVDSPLSRREDRAVFGATSSQRISLRLFYRTGRSGAVKAALAEENPLLVHAHFANEGALVRGLVKRLDLPLIVTAHGRDVTAGLTGKSLRARVRRRRLRGVFRNADLVIAVSEFIRSSVLNLGADPKKVVVHHIGIPVRPLRDVQKRWDVLFVGRLVDKKGVLDLLRALETLSDLAPRVGLIGTGPLLDEIRSRIYSTRVDVTLLGSKAPDEVYEELLAARIFAGPSQSGPDGDSEGFGMVFLEAAAAGVPVVAYEHGGVPEAVQDGVTGLLAPERDVSGLAMNMRTLLEDEELRISMGRAGRARVEDGFEVRSQTRILEALYAEVLARTRRPRPRG